MRNTSKRLAAVAAGAGLLAFTPGIAAAQDHEGPGIPALCTTTGGWSSTTSDDATPMAMDAELSVVDAQFLRFAAQAGLAEVASGQLAEERGKREETRAFGARMVAEHSRQAAELETLAAQFGIELPTTPDPASALTTAQLAELPAEAFDLAFFEVQADAHLTVLQEFALHARFGTNDCVQAWAAGYLPVLADHLREADENILAIGGADDDTHTDGTHTDGMHTDGTGGADGTGTAAGGTGRDGMGTNAGVGSDVRSTGDGMGGCHGADTGSSSDTSF